MSRYVALATAGAAAGVLYALSYTVSGETASNVMGALGTLGLLVLGIVTIALAARRAVRAAAFPTASAFAAAGSLAAGAVGAAYVALLATGLGKEIDFFRALSWISFTDTRPIESQVASAFGRAVAIGAVGLAAVFSLAAMPTLWRANRAAFRDARRLRAWLPVLAVAAGAAAILAGLFAGTRHLFVPLTPQQRRVARAEIARKVGVPAGFHRTRHCIGPDELCFRSPRPVVQPGALVRLLKGFGFQHIDVIGCPITYGLDHCGASAAVGDYEVGVTVESVDVGRRQARGTTVLILPDRRLSHR